MTPVSPPNPPSQPTPESRLVASLLDAYSQGWFPMAHPEHVGEDAEPEVEWVQPRRRAIIPLDERFHVPKSLAQRVRSRRFTITTDLAFEAVIRSCAESPRKDLGGEPTDSAWLVPEIVDAFVLLHKYGHAHSIEAWSEGPSLREGVGGRVGSSSSALPRPLDSSTPSRVLVGGLYGLALGKVFCGESMFHNAELGGIDASKVCLVQLVAHLRARGFELLDAQLANHHTAQFGMYEMPRAEYLRKLATLSGAAISWTPFEPI